MDEKDFDKMSPEEIKNEVKKMSSQEVSKLRNQRAIQEQLEVETMIEQLMSKCQDYPDIKAHLDKIMNWQAQKTNCVVNITNTLEIIRKRLKQLEDDANKGLN